MIPFHSRRTKKGKKKKKKKSARSCEGSQPNISRATNGLNDESDTRGFQLVLLSWYRNAARSLTSNWIFSHGCRCEEHWAAFPSGSSNWHFVNYFPSLTDAKNWEIGTWGSTFGGLRFCGQFQICIYLERKRWAILFFAGHTIQFQVSNKSSTC